ncbi:MULTISPECIES: hypothetical protein [unclassified Streptomyces]|uniref:hypothetical protein n=1 Tax=unclassified Streptomyces TaxID=2593676 RepID=UPI002E18E326|nr:MULTISPECIES: hypothetical protein [unclassified Streptomyces]
MIKRLKKLATTPASGTAAASGAGGGVGAWSGLGSDAPLVMPGWLWALLGAVLAVLVVATVKNIRDVFRLERESR